MTTRGGVRQAVQCGVSEYGIVKQGEPLVHTAVGGDSVESKVKVFNGSFSTFAVDWATVTAVAHCQFS